MGLETLLWVVFSIQLFVLIYRYLEKNKTTKNEFYQSQIKLSEENNELKNLYAKLNESHSDSAKLMDQYKRKQEQLLDMEEKYRLLFDTSMDAKKEFVEKLNHLKYHDPLTGLENRAAFNEKLQILIEDKNTTKFALVFVDVDNFKYINDAMGHTVGDKLLQKVSHRLIHHNENKATMYKVGADEFLILLEQYNQKEDIERFAVSVIKSFKNQIEVDAFKILITVSIGISLFPEHGLDVETLFKNADIAVYKAKETGRNRIVFYNMPMNELIVERMYIEKYMWSALDHKEFELYYQPQLDLETNQISGFEALIRWMNPRLGMVSPEKFISIAEDNRLIISIGAWVMKTACEFLKKLHGLGYHNLNISINISMLQLLQDNFLDLVMDTIEAVNLSSKHIELEITESILMESYEAIAYKLKLLRARGIKIALDDFGKGYSSLNYLRQLPITTLKIDKSFIDTISQDAKDKSLTDLIINLGRSMDLCVVAEGVETQEQYSYLTKYQCNKMQGYLFSKPIPENEVLNKLSGHWKEAGNLETLIL